MTGPIDFSKAVDLSHIGDRRMENPMQYAVDVLPSEKNAINAAVAYESASQETVRAFHDAESWNDLTDAVRAFSGRLTDRVASLGFVVNVSTDMFDPDNFDMYGNPDAPSIVWHPKVDVVARMDNKKDLDEDKRAYEIRTGQADGKVGRVKTDGTWDEEPFSSKMIS